MGRISYVKVKRDVSIYADCESIFGLILDKAASVAGSLDNIDIDDSNGICIVFNNGEIGRVDMNECFRNLSEVIGVGIAAAAVDFDLEYDENDIELDEWSILINGTEQHDAVMETWEATYEEPGDCEISGEEVDFNEEKCSKWAMNQLENLSIENMQSIFEDGFAPCERWTTRTYLREKGKIEVVERFASKKAFETAKKIVDAMKFTDEELKTAFSKVRFSWDLASDYDIEESDYDPRDDY